MKTEFSAAQAATSTNTHPLDIGARVFGRYHVFSENTSRGPVAWMASSQREFYLLQGVVGRLVLRPPSHYYGFRVVGATIRHHRFEEGTEAAEPFDPQYLGYHDGKYYYLRESGEYTPISSVPSDFYEG